MKIDGSAINCVQFEFMQVASSTSDMKHEYNERDMNLHLRFCFHVDSVCAVHLSWGHESHPHYRIAQDAALLATAREPHILK